MCMMFTCSADLLSEKMMTGLIKSVTMLLSSKCKQVVKACLDFVKVGFNKIITFHSIVIQVVIGVLDPRGLIVYMDGLVSGHGEI